MENLVVNFILLNKLRKDQGKTFADISKRIGVPEGTVKNVILGKSKRPGADVFHKICEDLGIAAEDALIVEGAEQIKVQLEAQAIKEGNVPVVALKEIYEQQLAKIAVMNETHINDIRAHYEQHHEDLIENYEKRLADKREIIDNNKEHVKSLRTIIMVLSISLGVCIVAFIGLLVAEVMNPNLGWFRY